MAGRNEKIRGYANEFIGAAKQIFGEMRGSKAQAQEGKHQKAKGEAQVEWGKAKNTAADKPKDPLDDMR